MERLWSRFDGWYVPSLVDEVAAEAASSVGAGQVAVAAVTDAYLARSSTLVRGEPVSPVGVPPQMRDTQRTGVKATDVYGRVASEFRWQFSRGVDVETARTFAQSRAVAMGGQDLSLAFQRQTASFTDRRHVKRFRRVTRPEKGTCGLCIAASNHTYTRGDLLPIHARCRCSVIEDDAVLGGGSVTSDETWAKLRGTARSMSATDLKDVRYVIDEHGELGPVLRDANQRVSKVRDGRVDTKKPKSGTPGKVLDPAGGVSAMTIADVERSEQIARKSLAYAKKNSLQQQIEWHTTRLQRLQARRAQLAT